jgi:SNF2 family DNA or RNA helicase
MAQVLRPYQVEGFRWLARLAAWGVGACLADDMGLGKTLQALAVLEGRAAAGPALVLAPTSVCSNWVREAERFAPGLRPILYRAVDREQTVASLGPGDVVIASYALLVRDAERFQKIRFGTLVLDEAQAVKNAATRRARAVRDLNADWRFALTGTPVENHLGELWSLFRILSPGLLGSWDQFRERFANPIERGKDAIRREALAQVVRPFVLRRTKAQVAPELPSRTEIALPIRLSAAERRLYDDARLAAAARLGRLSEGGDAEGNRFQVLAEITKLRQLACHPRLVDPESAIQSSKLERFLEVVETLREEGHRALVFSQFVKHLDLAREALDARGVRYLYLDGATPAAERDRRVDAFQAGEGELFLISLKAGGTGLNLTAATLRDPPRPVVEPGGRGPGHRPRPPHRPGEAGHRLPAGGGRDH